MQKPMMIHWKEALRVLAYVKNSLRKGFIHENHGHLNIKAYSYSNYAEDRGGKKSTSGYYTYIGGNLIT